MIDGAREQWNDGSNTLCIRPGVVVTYDRNYVSNNLLRKRGIKVIEIPGSELVRGRGGPRCMESTIIQRRFIESYSNTCYSVVEIAFNFKTNHIKF